MHTNKIKFARFLFEEVKMTLNNNLTVMASISYLTVHKFGCVKALKFQRIL